MSHIDNIPGPAFDPADLEAALDLADRLEMAVEVCTGLDTADEVLFVGPFCYKPGTPSGRWANGDGIEWFVQRHPGTGSVEVAENGGDGALAYVATASEALLYIARTRELRAA